MSLVPLLGPEYGTGPFASTCKIFSPYFSATLSLSVMAELILEETISHGKIWLEFDESITWLLRSRKFKVGSDDAKFCGKESCSCSSLADEEEE